MYADSDFYASRREGVSENECIPEREREVYLRKAGSYLDFLFAGKKPDEPYSDALKDACCEIADFFYKDERRAGIVSETNDGYSVTFTDGENSVNARAYDIAARYLGMTELMYMGVGI